MNQEQNIQKIKEKIHSYKDKIGYQKTLKIIITLSIALILIVGILVALLSIKIKSIEIIGDVTVYNEGVITNSSEVSEGMSLFAVTSYSIEKNLKENIPMIESVKIKKKIMGGKLTIELEFAEYEYFFEHKDFYYCITSDLVVKDVKQTKEECINAGARYIEIPQTTTPHMGQQISFFDTLEDQTNEDGEEITPKDPEVFAYVSEFLTFIQQTSYYENCNDIFLDEKFNIIVIYNSKYKIYFGDSQDLQVKISVLDGIINEGLLEGATACVIDISDPSKATSRVDSD